MPFSSFPPGVQALRSLRVEEQEAKREVNSAWIGRKIHSAMSSLLSFMIMIIVDDYSGKLTIKKKMVGGDWNVFVCFMFFFPMDDIWYLNGI